MKPWDWHFLLPLRGTESHAWFCASKRLVVFVLEPIHRLFERGKR